MRANTRGRRIVGVVVVVSVVVGSLIATQPVMGAAIEPDYHDDYTLRSDADMYGGFLTAWWVSHIAHEEADAIINPVAAAAAAAEGLSYEGVLLCEYRDALVNGAEIEAAYLNAALAVTQLDAHRADSEAHLEDIDSDVHSHDTAVMDAFEDSLDILKDTVWALDNKTEQRQVHLQVVELQEKSEFLVSATESGVPVADVQFTSVKLTDGKAASFEDATPYTTVSMVETGVYVVGIDLQPSMRNSRIYAFEVKHLNDLWDHYGYVLFDRQSQGNLAGGL